jgi:hypothetical protein
MRGGFQPGAFRRVQRLSVDVISLSVEIVLRRRERDFLAAIGIDEAILPALAAQVRASCCGGCLAKISPTLDWSLVAVPLAM